MTGKNDLALFGGEKVKKNPFTTGSRYSENDLGLLKKALDQNTLFYAFGSITKDMCEKVKNMFGVQYCIPVSSGTAALHTAIAAAGVGAGDEVITSPITDMGTLIGILFQQAIPVFADVDPFTFNIDPDSVRKCINGRTRAILPVHLTGSPCDMNPIMDIARENGIPVIEDCAQSWLAEYGGKYTGTIGDMGCFSMNDFKHISCGDGGLIITDDPFLAKNAMLFSDKGYDRSIQQRNPATLGMNYRITELQSAVTIAQMDRLPGIVKDRTVIGEKLICGFNSVEGIIPQKIVSGGKSSYWFAMFRIDRNTIKTDIHQFGKALEAEGIPNMAGYIGRCVYQYELFQKKNFFANMNWPEDIARFGSKLEYRGGLCPNAEEVIGTCIAVTFSEFISEEDTNDIIRAVEKVAAYYGK